MKSNLKTILAMVMFTIALPIGAQMFSNLDMNCVVPYSNDETIAPRNLILIKMNWEKMSLLNGSLIEIENLRKNLKDIIRNANNDNNLPTIKYQSYHISHNKTIAIRYTEYHLCVIIDNSLSTDDYEVRLLLHEMVGAIEELREECCMMYFGCQYSKCNYNQQQLIEKILPCKIAIGKHSEYVPQLPPPPPPPLPIVDNFQDEELYEVVEQMPEFPGGIESLMTYIATNVNYPIEAQKLGIQGRVLCQFIVNKDGKVVEVVVAKSSGNKYLDNEAIRVINSMPNWVPGRHKGETVRVQYKLPINFSL